MNIIKIDGAEHLIQKPKVEIQRIDSDGFIWIKTPTGGYRPISKKILINDKRFAEYTKGDLYRIDCKECKGKGEWPDEDKKMEHCWNCNGSGQIEYKIDKVELKQVKELDIDSVYDSGLSIDDTEKYLLISNLTRVKSKETISEAFKQE